MANSDQSKYRAERANKVRARRSRQLSTLRTAIKKLRKGLLEKASKENLATLLTSACTMLDRAVTKRLVHANHAARVKSRLNAQVKLEAA